MFIKKVVGNIINYLNFIDFFVIVIIKLNKYYSIIEYRIGFANTCNLSIQIGFGIGFFAFLGNYLYFEIIFSNGEGFNSG